MDHTPHTSLSSTPKRFRYPGVQPFTTRQSDVFFGREQDTKGLYRMIRRTPLCVLYGKSGLGKSSIINAGIIPKCEEERSFEIIKIRFGAWTSGTEDTPLEITRNCINSPNASASFLDQLIPQENSLWSYAKKRQASKEGRLLLIFDQFEELFTFPEPQIQAFKKDLAELLHTGIPLRFRRMADRTDSLTEEEEDILEEPLDIRLLFAIRSDRMHLLHMLSDQLSTIFDGMYELQALRPEDAVKAIQQPAKAKGDFQSPAFMWEESATHKLMAFLKDRENGNRVEGILLQLLCQYFEEKLVVEGGLRQLSAAQLGELEKVVEQFYFERIASLGDEDTQRAARRLIEEGLVLEGENIRLSLHEAQINRQFNLEKGLLERLVDSRLLRAEPFLRGGYSYELAHDRLVAPVLEAKLERKAAEAKSAQRKRKLELKAAREKAKQEQALREKAEVGQKQAQQRSRLALGLAGLALLFAVTAGLFFFRAQSSSALAEAQRFKAEQALDNFLQENAAKERLKFQDLKRRANTILEAGLCPEELLGEMEVIAKSHPDSVTFHQTIETLRTKNPDCQ